MSADACDMQRLMGSNGNSIIAHWLKILGPKHIESPIHTLIDKGEWKHGHSVKIHSVKQSLRQWVTQGTSSKLLHSYATQISHKAPVQKLKEKSMSHHVMWCIMGWSLMMETSVCRGVGGSQKPCWYRQMYWVWNNWSPKSCIWKYLVDGWWWRLWFKGQASLPTKSDSPILGVIPS